MDRNLRSRQECARAWSRLSSKQISMRRQVCSACPHSCTCLQLFSFPSAARFRHVTCSKTGMLAHEHTVWGFPPLDTLVVKFPNIKKVFSLYVLLYFPAMKVKEIPSSYLLPKNSTSFPLEPGNPFPPCEFLLCTRRAPGEEWDHCEAKASFVKFRWLFKTNTSFKWNEWRVEENFPLSLFMHSFFGH